MPLRRLRYKALSSPLTEVMNNYVSLDETTGVATRKSFMGRLQEEVQRANDFSNELSIVMISIDRMDDHTARYGREAFDFILQNVGMLQLPPKCRAIPRAQ